MDSFKSLINFPALEGKRLPAISTSKMVTIVATHLPDAAHLFDPSPGPPHQLPFDRSAESECVTSLRHARNRAVPEGGQHDELKLKKADRKHRENRSEVWHRYCSSSIPERRMMNRETKSSADPIVRALLIRGGLALLVLLAWFMTAKGQSQPESSIVGARIRATHVLGFEDVRRNVSGELSIQDGNLRFERDKTPTAQVSITSIENISLSEQDKQVGGVPLMMGKAALPYGGGRMVSLFSHKKYDSLTIEYLDSTGGFHVAIFRLAKKQGEIFKSALIAHGAHIRQAEAPAPLQSTLEEFQEGQTWSVQVGRVDPGATTVDPCFSAAIYENLLQKLSKSKEFKHVFRSGDRNANVSGVLALKTVVEKYSPGSETRRAVTTVTGATKLKVRIQLVTRNGHVVLDRAVEGNVRFIGDNLGATKKVANNTAKILKRTTVPAAVELDRQQTVIKEAIGII